jgi:cytidylate kinase
MESVQLTGQAGIIAIDGQTAAGKTAAGRELAHRLGCPFLDTGIMYRAITWLALRRSVAMADETGLGNLASECTMRPIGTDGNGILLNDVQLGHELRSAQVDEHVSLVARVPSVRRELVSQQRNIAAQSSQKSGGIVMVGRDIGTVVLPDAYLKVFMVASPEVRAQRRYDELASQGQAADYLQILANALSRDRIDSERDDSPLVQAADAVVIDTSDLTINQVVEKMLELLSSLARWADS